jgi:hypothetical protein
MQRLANAWRLAKASWQVLSKDRELVVIPLVAGVGAILAFAVFALPGTLLLGDTASVEASNTAQWLFWLLGAIAAMWITAVGQGAVVAGAAHRMDGGNPSVGSSLVAARERAVNLLSWAVLATVVAIILDQIEQRLGALGRVASWLGGVAFSIMSFLALPVIMFENVGAIEAFKRSSVLLKRTWGEQIGFNFGLGLLGLLLILPVVVISGGLIATELFLIQALGILIGVVWIGLVAATMTALSAVFKAALYRYANGLPVDPAYDAEDLSGAFRSR